MPVACVAAAGSSETAAAVIGNRLMGSARSTADMSVGRDRHVARSCARGLSALRKMSESTTSISRLTWNSRRRRLLGVIYS